MTAEPDPRPLRREDFAERVAKLDPAERERITEGMRRNRRDDANLRLLLALSLRSTANCVDVGAHVGKLLGELVRLAPDGHHIAFEPIPALYQRLRERWPALDCREVALSDTSGETDFVHVPELSGYSGLRRQRYPFPVVEKTIRIHTRRLDEILPDGYVPHVIKVDVEGAELQVFRGAVDTIRTHQPLIAFEHGRAARNFATTPADVYDLLVRDARLRIFDLDGQGPYSLAEFEESCASDVRWNYVAHA